MTYETIRISADAATAAPSMMASIFRMIQTSLDQFFVLIEGRFDEGIQGVLRVKHKPLLA
jgi:hypothetical protein